MQQHSPLTLPVLPVNVGCDDRGWLIGPVCRGNDLVQHMHGQFFLLRSGNILQLKHQAALTLKYLLPASDHLFTSRQPCTHRMNTGDVVIIKPQLAHLLNVFLLYGIIKRTLYLIDRLEAVFHLITRYRLA